MGNTRLFKHDAIRQAAFRVALRYAFFSSLWILFSDQAVLLAFDDPGFITAVQSVKGWAFVGLSAAVIYMLMLRELRRLNKAESALNEQRSFMNAVFENSPAVMYLKHADGKYISTNFRFCELFGLKHEGIVGKTDHELFPAVWADLFSKHDQEVLSSGMTQSFQEIAPHPDGSLHTYISVKFPVVRSDGRPSDICGISTDISDLVALEEKLQRTERLNALGRLTGGIAHDFNNHLTVIIGCLQLLQGTTVGDEERMKLAREASRASFQAASLVDRLLSYARNQILILQDIDVNQAIREIDTLVSRSLGDTVALHYALDARRLCAVLDPVQLESAILNLTINARDAMPEGGSLTIRSGLEEVGVRESAVEAIMPGSYVRIDIEDTGEGMTADVLEKALEPFYTTKELGKGTGLGLSMVDGFARQSKGCVRVRSTPGRGTTVSILLPASAGPVSSERVPTPDIAPRARRGNGEVILLVEDEPALRAFASRVLENQGYKVLQASSGVDAIALMDSGAAIDLLFSDIMLPGGVLGPDLAEQFQSRFPGKGVILTSGYVEPGTWSSESKFKVLKKPYSRDALLRELGEHVE